MAQIIKSLSLDVSRQNRVRAILAKQYDNDSRFLKVQLNNEGEPIAVAPTSTVLINATRTDGESESFMGYVNDDGSVTVPITYWMLEVPGRVRCDISVISEQGSKLSSLSFSIEVEKTNGVGESIDEQENGSILVQLISDVKKLEDSFKTVFIRYSANADGENYSETWTEGMRYIGIANTDVEPDDKNGYVWCRFATSEEGNAIVVDSELSLESENPVQNKVVTQEFKAFNEAIGDTNRRVSALEGGGMQATVVDLTALGLPPIEVGMGQTLTTDTTEIIAALNKGIVTFGLDIVREGGTIHYNVTTNTLNANGMYFCYFTGGDGNEQETISIAVGTGIVIAAVSVTPVGGGVSSWNDLTDKPFGENADGTIKQLDNKYLEPFEFQAGSEIDILPRQDVQFASGEGAPNGVAVFVVGETYRVKWDATEYAFEAKSVAFDGIDGIAIGNTSLIGVGEDTGEEFVLGYAPAYNINLFVTKPTDNGTHSVRIYQSTPDKWTLKESHLPFDAIAAYIDNYINEALGGDY